MIAQVLPPGIAATVPIENGHAYTSGASSSGSKASKCNSPESVNLDGRSGGICQPPAADFSRYRSGSVQRVGNWCHHSLIASRISTADPSAKIVTCNNPLSTSSFHLSLSFRFIGFPYLYANKFKTARGTDRGEPRANLKTLRGPPHHRPQPSV